MKKTISLIFGGGVALLASLFIYSCADDTTTIISSEATNENAQIEYRGAEIDDVSCFDPFAMEDNCINSILLSMDTMQFQAYGNCIFEATWTTWQCLSEINGQLEYRVVLYDFSAAPVSGACDSLTNVWDQYADTNQDALLLQSMEDFQVEATKIVESYTLENIVPDLFQIDCENPNGTQLFTEFYRSICNQLYKVKVVKGRLFYYKFETVSCGDVCCVRETRYCYNNGIPEAIGDPALRVVGECKPGDGGPYGIGFTAVGACEDECSQ